SDVLAPYLDDIAPQKVEVNSVDGGIYGVPFDFTPGLLFYNAAALDAAGVDVCAIETYDDLLDAARAYKAAKPESGPMHLERSEFLGQLQLEMYAGQLGTSLADADGELRLDSPAFEQVLTFLDTVRAEELGTRAEYLSPTDLAELENGNQVFYPWAIWFSFAPQQLLTDTAGQWRAMQLPAWEPGGARSGADGWFVVRGAQRRRERRTSVAVLRVPDVRRGRLHGRVGAERRLPAGPQHLDTELPARSRPVSAAVRAGRGSRGPG